jgi:hypothetical protein
MSSNKLENATPEHNAAEQATCYINEDEAKDATPKHGATDIPRQTGPYQHT